MNSKKSMKMKMIIAQRLTNVNFHNLLLSFLYSVIFSS